MPQYFAGLDQRLLASFAALAAGKPDEAEQGYRAVLQDYPDDLEAQWQLATVLNVYNPLRGRPIVRGATLRLVPGAAGRSGNRGRCSTGSSSSTPSSSAPYDP